jgi:8-oxo-dGTP diphosphatase
MKSKHRSLVAFYHDNKILLQNRKSMSKWGELWGFWGGGIEKNETKEEAAYREIKEELEIDLDNLKFLGTVKGVLERKDGSEQVALTLEVFVSKVVADAKFQVNEGDGYKFITIEEARKLRMVLKIDAKVLDLIEKYLETTH